MLTQSPLTKLVLLALALVMSDCSSTPLAVVAPIPSSIATADDALAVQSQVTDCEWKATNQYDNSHYSIAELARQVMGVCAVELMKAARAFGLSPNDPQIEADQFRQAVENVEVARFARSKGR